MMDSHQKKAFSDHTTIGSGIILKKKKKRKNESYKCKLTASNTMTVQLCFLSNSHHLHGINCAPRFPHNGTFKVHTALWHEQDQSN
jgi:hypothetical protein